MLFYFSVCGVCDEMRSSCFDMYIRWMTCLMWLFLKLHFKISYRLEVRLLNDFLFNFSKLQ